MTPHPPAMHPAVTLHDRKAAEWDQLYALPSFRHRVAVILGLLEGSLNPGAAWLDAGCGSGFFTRQLASRGCAVTGLDASPAMIDAARRLTASGQFPFPPQFELVPTIEHLTAPAGTFAGILCSSLLEYLNDPAVTLREFARVLQPGGVLLLTVPNRTSLARLTETAMFKATKILLPRPWPAYRSVSQHHYARQELTALLADTGFRAEAFDWFGALFPSWITRRECVGMMTAVRAIRK